MLLWTKTIQHLFFDYCIACIAWWAMYLPFNITRHCSISHIFGSRLWELINLKISHFGRGNNHGWVCAIMQKGCHLWKKESSFFYEGAILCTNWWRGLLHKVQHKEPMELGAKKPDWISGEFMSCFGWCGRDGLMSVYNDIVWLIFVGPCFWTFSPSGNKTKVWYLCNDTM